MKMAQNQSKKVHTIQKNSAPVTALSGAALAGLPEVLLPWYDRERRDLPWRNIVTPYRTWVSEIMLQQTRVQAVLPYFQRFMEAAPDVAALAELPEERLLSLWQGLGYYSRARNLQKAARIMAERYGGCLPDTYKQLIELPGIGDYTAGAILSIAFGQAVPSVDGNVLRIAARLTACRENVLDTRTHQWIREALAAVMPADRPGDLNQALMDLGAGICLPKNPDCGSCPAATLCAARAARIQNELPVREKRGEKPTIKRTVFLLTDGEGRTALRRRPDKGLLAGLWEYPNVEGELTESLAAQQLAAWKLTPKAWESRFSDKHIFTHQIWDMVIYRITVSGEGTAEMTWVSPAERADYPMPTAFSKLGQQRGKRKKGADNSKNKGE